MKKQAVASLVVVFVAGIGAFGSAQGPVPPVPPAGPPVPGVPVRDITAAARTGTASIRGLVTATDTGAPLRRAEVELSGGAGPQRNVVATDEQGYYEFRALPPGRYSLSVSKAGYMRLAYGQRRPFEAGRAVEVAQGQALTDVNFSLPRGGAIVVRVTDEFGEPIAGVRVAAQQYRFTGGERTLTTVASGASLGPGTDDRGEMHLHGLAPGDYYIGVARAPANLYDLMADRGRVYAAAFYPGTLSPDDAQKVTVLVGQETAVSFPLVPVKVVSVSGIIQASDGTVPSGVSVAFIRQTPGGGLAPGGVSMQRDGSFVIANVLPGEYTLTVRPPLGSTSNTTQEYARVPVTVTGEDISGLRITTGKGTTLRGRFVFDTGTPPALEPGVSGGIAPSLSFLRTSDGMSAVPKVNPDWSFEIAGILGSPAVVRAAQFLMTSDRTVVPPSWFLKAVIINGRDTIDTPLNFDSDVEINDVQLVMTQKRTELTGNAVDSQNAPVTDYAVVLFPENQALWTGRSRYIGTARPDQKGQFNVTGLPPGRYLAAAVDYLATSEERDPDLLTRLKDRATAVTLVEGDVTRVTVPVTLR